MVSDISSYEESILKERQEDEYMHLDFRDATSGDATYTGGRFLVAEMPKEGKLLWTSIRLITRPALIRIMLPALCLRLKIVC